MPKISFAKRKDVIEVAPGANLMQSLLDAGHPVGSSCGGEGVCSKCPLIIVKGLEQLSPENDIEKELRIKNGLSDKQRVSCQTQVLGDITIDADYW